MEDKKIYSAIVAVMQDLQAVAKDRRNNSPGGNFMYRGIDDVMNALHPALCKAGVFVTPEVLEEAREERTSNAGKALLYVRLKIKYSFYTVDGSSISSTVIGEAMDTGDKASNKAMSIAFKYAMFQVFCIPTEEMQDPDAESPQPQPRQPQQNQQQPPQQPPQQPRQQAKCESCGNIIAAIKNKKGGEMSAAKVAEYSRKRFGRCLCPECQRKQLEHKQENQENNDESEKK